jgi:hypothetical protein
MDSSILPSSMGANSLECRFGPAGKTYPMVRPKGELQKRLRIDGNAAAWLDGSASLGAFESMRAVRARRETSIPGAGEWTTSIL